MKVLLVNGSPNEKGCTYTALQEVGRTLEGLGIEAETFWIGKKPIGGCIACHKCRDIGRCVFNDVVNEFRAKALTADGFVFGSPVHYAALAGNMTSFMDRVFYSEANGNGNKAFGTTVSFDQMNKYFTIQEMPVISSRYWNEVHGAVPEEVLQDKEGMYTMRVLGRNMAYFLRCQDAARQAGVALPEQEAPIFTNFIR